jgi:hypothetical protein
MPAAYAIGALIAALAASTIALVAREARCET